MEKVKKEGRETSLYGKKKPKKKKHTPPTNKRYLDYFFLRQSEKKWKEDGRLENIERGG